MTEAATHTDPPKKSPRKRDPEATRRAILDAAEFLFMRSGFAGASMSELASRAAVTKSLIHHHFGSKEELWEEVCKRRSQRWAGALERLIQDGEESAEILKRSLVSYFTFLRENPQFVRMSAWMSVEHKPSQVLEADLLGLGIRRLQEGQARCELRSDVDARHVIAMLDALCMHWFVAREGLELSGLRKSGSDDADDRYLADLVRVFLRGLAPDPERP